MAPHSVYFVIPFYTRPGSYIPLDGGTITLSYLLFVAFSEAIVGQHDEYARYISRKADTGGDSSEPR